MDGGRTVHETPATPVREAPVPAPVVMPVRTTRASSAIVQPKLVVGASDDPYEREADAIASRVMADMRTGNDAAMSAPSLASSSRIRRMSAAGVQRAADVIGAAGGAVDADTERAINSARSGGQALDTRIRRRMEGAMGADFGGVRVHVGQQSDDLNSRIQARAFTSGSDIFVRRQDYAPSTPNGQRLLAHELAHTVQQGAAPQVAQRSHDPIAQSIQRSGGMIQRWDWWEKRKADKATAAAAEKQQKEIAAAAAKQAADDKAAKAPYKGNAAQAPNTTVEIAKPAVSVGATALTGGLSTLSSADYASGAAGAVLGPILLADSAMGLAGAYSMHNEAAAHKDAGMAKMAGGKAKQMGGGVVAAGLSTSKAGVDIANVSAGTAHVAAGAGQAALGVASGSIGIATGSIQVLQGAWRGGQAAMKLCRLTWGRGSQMLSQAGEEWKRATMRAEKFKLAINGLKVALGVLGIAAGALLIVSNPIGWAIGIAAAVAGGVYAVSKIAAKVKNTKDLESAGVAAKVRAGARAEQLGDAPKADEAAAEPKSGWNKGKPRVKQGTGGAKPVEAGAPENKRKAAIDEANAVARVACENAATAGEMREALSHGNLADVVWPAIQTYANDAEFEPAASIKQIDDRQLYDAIQILSSINISYEQALSDSGQDLIQKKLSKADAM